MQNRRDFREIGAVHPHGRGDNHANLDDAADAGGSPPRAWGQSRKIVWMVTTIRFTPTGVGTIMGETLRLLSVTVHPHGRGDNRSYR